jgi:hypothetical protein
MEEVPYYGLSWFIYLLLSASFLLMSIWRSRRMKFWLRIPMLCFIAAMAFTPATTMPGQDWWSPAAIVMVFEIDQSGLSGFLRAGLGIIIVWIVLTIGTFLARWILNRRGNKQPGTSVQTELEEPK